MSKSSRVRTRRVLSLALVFIMMLSILGSSGYTVFADDVLGEEFVEDVHDHVCDDEDCDLDHDHDHEHEDEVISEGGETVAEPESAAEPDPVAEPVEAAEDGSDPEEAVEPVETTEPDSDPEPIDEPEDASEPEEVAGPEEIAEPVEATEEEPVEDTSDGETEGDSATPYARTEVLADGSSFVLAYEQDGTYYVVARDSGELTVLELDELNSDTVTADMLWEMSGTAI